MTPTQDIDRHEEVWLLLPWLANGRVTEAERAQAEQHVRGCALCSRELSLERRLCQALASPDRITYAPGPSFRKLLKRIDGAPASASAAAPRLPVAPWWQGAVSLWRPPGLAWAATFVLGIGLAAGLAYRAAVPTAGRYVVHTDPRPAEHSVLHIAFDRKLTIGEVEELLRKNGARVVEGPGETGIFGVRPDEEQAMRALATKLRTDPRVRWVEPMSTGAPDSAPRER
jgi:hypothetical protein